AMGAVVRALGSAVVIDTTSSAYDEPVESARSFSLRYPKPISADVDIREVVQRFHEGTKVLRDAKLGLVDLEHDPLLDDKERGELRKTLQGAHAEAERVLDVTHLSADERAAIVARLERGWVTGKKQRVIDALSS